MPVPMPLALDLTITVVFGCLISFVCWVLKQWWIDVRYNAYLPPGPSRLPFLGNAHQLSVEGQHKTFAEWGKKYGDVIYARIFNRPVLVLNSVEAAHDLLNKRSATYSDRPRFVLLVEMFGSYPNTALMPYGPWWRQHRTWLNAVILDRGSLAGYQPLLRRETSKLVVALAQSPVRLVPHIKRFVGSLMLEIAYGHTTTSEGEDLIALADTVVREAMAEGSLAGTLVDFFPVLKHIPTWFPSGGFKSRAARIRCMMHEMMNKPYRQVEAALASGTAKASFLTTWLQDLSADGDLTPEHEEHLKGAASVLYTGGTDTTSTALSSFFLAMVLHPGVIMKAQEEIDRVVGDGRLPDFDDRSSLPYLECVLSELYRWNPPLYLGVPHQLIEDDDYGRWHIPQRCMVIPNIWSMSRNAEQYPDPEAFRPERFQEMVPSVAEISDPCRYVFGFGRRICPGRKLADQTLWFAIATILAVFDIDKASDGDGNGITPDAAFSLGGVSHPQPFSCAISLRVQKVNLVASLKVNGG